MCELMLELVNRKPPSSKEFPKSLIYLEQVSSLNLLFSKFTQTLSFCHVVIIEKLENMEKHEILITY
jgi:hypothetical protein